MDRARLFASVTGSSGILVRHHKRNGSISGMAPGNSSSSSSSGGNSQISLFKLTTSSGNAFEQPIGPGEQFSGVVVIQLLRPMPASQIVLELAAEERVAQGGKGSSKALKSQPFYARLAVWTAVRKGAAASTVLSDGIHVFNFVCQMPYVNYPQTLHRAEFDIAYRLSGKLLAPGEGTGASAGGAEQVVALVEKELFVSPVVTRMASPDPLLVVETLCFEKKGRRGKAAVELRAAIGGHQVVPGTKVAIDLSIRELGSAGWTKVVARLIERTACRHDGQALSSQPLWTADHQLAYCEAVRSSVYNFFLNDEVMGKKQADTKTADGETVSSESLALRVPLAAAGHVGSEHLEFAHFIRLEVLVPSWLASDRSVHVDIPVQIMTHTAAGAARALSRQQTGSGRSSLSERLSQEDAQGSSAASIRDGALRLSHDACAAIVGSLPPRYCDMPAGQRAAPELALVTQANGNGGRRESAQSRATRHTTMSSVQSLEMAMSPVLGGTLLPPPPPLPSAPMPTLDIGEPAALAILTPAASGVSSPMEGVVGPLSPGPLSPVKRRQNSAGSAGGVPRTPVSPMMTGDAAGDASSDEDAGYFKSMGGGDERPAERGLFRLRKNSSVKHSR
ncbi:hypothetical protein LPJ53_000914 [Coemansia erecta]|uniref:Arrestin C-terminal-like domain-containing protein n=1 Tax=Coemansia erecta TaxID=147472 RepID=A0A9W7Y105_9FUNG|nr:hypothetical protein LPJ53_000914 [Coemansia erecta]